MKKFILFALLLLSIVLPSHAYDFDVNRWTVFEGKLGISNIQLALYCFDDGRIKGNYYYQRNNRKINLVGEISGDNIKLTELLNGKPNGYFVGKVFTNDRDRFEGIRKDRSRKKTTTFKLTLSSISGSDYNDKYTFLSGTDDAVENFMRKVKVSILKGDKSWIANHVSYPIKTSLDKKNRITIKNKKQLINNFYRIFHAEYRRKIESYYTSNLFNNYQGAMIGRGEIWINSTPKSKNNKYGYLITAINNVPH